MVKRVGHEIQRYINELGSEGRLLLMQLEELISGVDEDVMMLIKDYNNNGKKVEKVRDSLQEADAEDLFDLMNISLVLGYDSDVSALDKSVHPHGYRLLRRIPRIPLRVINKLVDHFSDLQSIIHASVEELDDVEGVGAIRAQAIQEGLRRLKEYNLLERYM